MAVIRISSTEAARHLGDYMARVKHKGESFVLTKNEQAVAVLGPVGVTRKATWADLVEAVAARPRDRGFADDLEKVNEADIPLDTSWD